MQLPHFISITILNDLNLESSSTLSFHIITQYFIQNYQHAFLLCIQIVHLHMHIYSINFHSHFALITFFSMSCVSTIGTLYSFIYVFIENNLFMIVHNHLHAVFKSIITLPFIMTTEHHCSFSLSSICTSFS
jgi:hypothetical protein